MPHANRKRDKARTLKALRQGKKAAGKSVASRPDSKSSLAERAEAARMSSLPYQNNREKDAKRNHKEDSKRDHEIRREKIKKGTRKAYTPTPTKRKCADDFNDLSDKELQDPSTFAKYGKGKQLFQCRDSSCQDVNCRDESDPGTDEDGAGQGAVQQVEVNGAVGGNQQGGSADGADEIGAADNGQHNGQQLEGPINSLHAVPAHGIVIPYISRPVLGCLVGVKVLDAWMSGLVARE